MALISEDSIYQLLQQILDSHTEEEAEEIKKLYNDLCMKTIMSSERLFAKAYYLGLQTGVEMVLDNINDGFLETGNFKDYYVLTESRRREICKLKYNFPENEIS
ncbi:MAG: hypothetical protein IKF90_10295 [Parasporobacterium sp.]|nr:hypothetical protein [Parasporobacterium sp.]